MYGSSRVTALVIALALPLTAGAHPGGMDSLDVLAERLTQRPVRELPLDFVLDDSPAMTPDARISSLDRVVLVARVSKSSVARPGPGDLEGTAGPVQVGANSLRVRIDRAMP